MFDRILVPLDGSALAERAVSVAESVARAFDGGLHLIRVLEPGRAGGLSRDCVERRLQQAESDCYLEALADGLRARDVDAETEVLEGKAAEEIVQAAREGGAELIVLSAYGQGGPGAHRLGSTAHKVVSTAGVSVLLLRGASLEAEVTPELSRILVPVDCSRRSEWALRVAASLARAAGAELLAVHVIPVPEMPHRLPRRPEDEELCESLVTRNRRAAALYMEEVERRLSAPGLELRTLMETSRNVTRTLNRIGLREDASLVVVSAHGLSGPSSWPFGSVTAGLIAYGDLPLLVLQDHEGARREPASAGTSAAELALHGAAR